MKGIFSKNKKGYIGLNRQLPWKSTDDLKHFKKMTMGCTLLVGYNTSKLLPNLKGREIIIDDDNNQNINYDEIDWCIGGKLTYEKHCHRFTELHISHINDNTIGDTEVPNFKKLDCKIFHYYFEVD